MNVSKKGLMKKKGTSKNGTLKGKTKGKEEEEEEEEQEDNNVLLLLMFCLLSADFLVLFLARSCVLGQPDKACLGMLETCEARGRLARRVTGVALLSYGSTEDCFGPKEEEKPTSLQNAKRPKREARLKSKTFPSCRRSHVAIYVTQGLHWAWARRKSEDQLSHYLVHMLQMCSWIYNS